ncbi:MAG: RNA polymerase sigma factor [Bacteroidota bacterium]|jgi:RNA polymerase sigma factor (sigma-70 family)
MKTQLLLISEQFPYFKSIALRSLPARYRHLAEDLAQDAILKAMENIHKYDPSKGNFKSWLFRLTQNLCFDAIRKMDRLPCIPMHPAQAAFPEKQHDLDRDNLQAIRRAMKHLCARDRELITYRILFELSGKEIAQLTGIPENQVNVYFQRAKNRLKSIAREAA